MQVYEIWSEGYSVTGESAGAMFHTIRTADSFKDACKLYAIENVEFGKYFDPNRMTFWGCGLFDNEKEAMINFG